MKLVVIEGPGKQATIKKYLGDDYTVFASKGHVRDLPPKGLSIDISDNFKPTYDIMSDKKAVITDLKKLAKNADKIYLATDPDREGEAISWHIANILGLDTNDKCRIAFNEISKSAVDKALQEPRTIDMNLVDAQQARRILDRLVGYKLSPIISKKIVSNLSAGRVQSVALKLIVDREREIQNFVPEEYWTVNANLKKDNIEFKTLLVLINGKKAKIDSKAKMEVVENELKNANYIVDDVKKEIKYTRPQAPFITSSMQQDAGIKLRMSLDEISKTAQSLYEGVSTKSMGKKALITYIRTDSTRVSVDAQKSAKEFIIKQYGNKYVPDKFNIYASKASAQEGHEAIRPIDINITPESIKSETSRSQYDLYKLIYDRFLASQMSNYVYDSLIVDVKATDKYTFRVSGKTPIFDGFKILYKTDEEDDDTDSGDVKLPLLQVQDKLDFVGMKTEQKFTKPPVRYTEPTFVKLMESKGIGRPATYVQTISTLFRRNYFVKDGKYFVPTEIGTKVADFLTEHFPNIMDVKFTADMEDQLDEIANGKLVWQNVLAQFYGPFEKQLYEVDKNAVKEEPIMTEEKCEKCGANMYLRNGKNGKFLACSNFPKCKFTKNFIDADSNQSQNVEVVKDVCDNCGATMVVRMGRNGKFLACPNYPKCKFTKPYIDKNEEVGVCPECKGVVTKRKSKTGKIFFSCSNYPTCKYMSWDLPTSKLCPKCKAQLFKKFGKEQDTLYCVNNCGYTINVEHNNEENNN